MGIICTPPFGIGLTHLPNIGGPVALLVPLAPRFRHHWCTYYSIYIPNHLHLYTYIGLSLKLITLERIVHIFSTYLISALAAYDSKKLIDVFRIISWLAKIHFVHNRILKKKLGTPISPWEIIGGPLCNFVTYRSKQPNHSFCLHLYNMCWNHSWIDYTYG